MYKEDETMHDSSCDSDNLQIFYWRYLIKYKFDQVLWYKFFTEACKSKSDGNLRQEKMREFQKSLAGKFSEKFYRKFLQKSFKWKFFGKFSRKFYGEILRKKKFYGGNGEPGLDWDLESCWSVTAPVRVTDLLASPDLPNFLT